MEVLHQFPIIEDALLWLLQHIYILLILYYNKINNFIIEIKKHFHNVDLVVQKLSTMVDQHERRIMNLERKRTNGF